MATTYTFVCTAVDKVGSQLTQKPSVPSNLEATADPRGTVVRMGGMHQDNKIKQQKC